MVKNNWLKILIIMALSGSNLRVRAQGLTGLSDGMNYFLYGTIAFVIAAMALALYFLRLKNKYQKEAVVRSGRPAPRSGLRKWWSQLDKRYFTKAASLEKEADVLLDHDYDGIKELDNALPPWWKWGFYITIAVGVIYLFRFHIIHSGLNPLQEYDKEMVAAAEQMENLKKAAGAAFDEKTITLADAKGLTEGKKIFGGTCFPCHGANAEGNAVGPNLTDNYWLHGGSLGEIFKTINNGVPDKGMQAWGKTFSPADIRNVASFIISLQGTNPPNAKGPQGNLYEPGKATDSTAAKKDLSQAKTTSK